MANREPRADNGGRWNSVDSVRGKKFSKKEKPGETGDGFVAAEEGKKKKGKKSKTKTMESNGPKNLGVAAAQGEENKTEGEEAAGISEAERIEQLRKFSGNINNPAIGGVGTAAETGVVGAMKIDEVQIISENEKDKAVKKKRPNGSSVSKHDAEKMEKNRFSRLGAEITLGRIDNFEELNAPNLTEGDKLFLAKTRKLWKEFAVHGFLKKDEKTGELYVDSNTDLDGKCCLELLKLAGIDTKDLKYVAPGEYEEDRINIDTGKRHGVSVERKISDQGIDWGKTAFVDHHAEESLHGSSASEFMYRLLTDLGLFKRTEKLNAMIDFVTSVDNAEYPDIENYYKNSWKTIAGLQRYIPGHVLVNFFLRNASPDVKKELSEAELRRYRLITENKNRSESQRNVVNVSRKRLEQMEQQGFIIPSARYGKIAVNLESSDVDDNGNGNGNGKKNIPGDIEAVRAFGCDTLVTWDPKNNRFKISARAPIAEEYSQGVKVRERMWIKNTNDEKLQVTLGEILAGMTDGKFVPEGKLKEYLEAEKGNPEKKEENESEKFGLPDEVIGLFKDSAQRVLNYWLLKLEGKEGFLESLGSDLRSEVANALEDEFVKNEDKLARKHKLAADKRREFVEYIVDLVMKNKK